MVVGRRNYQTETRVIACLCWNLRKGLEMVASVFHGWSQEALIEDRKGKDRRKR